jgi:hypothetical protein
MEMIKMMFISRLNNIKRMMIEEYLKEKLKYKNTK